MAIGELHAQDRNMRSADTKTGTRFEQMSVQNLAYFRTFPGRTGCDYLLCELGVRATISNVVYKILETNLNVGEVHTSN